jgi:hypothetical protein
MATNPSPLSQTSTPPPSGRLPPRDQRVLVTAVISRVLDLKIEIWALVEDVPKNELVIRALGSFLQRAKACEAAYALRPKPRDKGRVTFILTKDLDQQLEKFAEVHKCQKTSVITAALIDYLQSLNIDPYSDPTVKVKKALQARLAPQVGTSDSF